MENRKHHCRFAKLNRNGRCIANCSENILRNFDSDCTGATGNTFDPLSANEVRISGAGCNNFSPAIPKGEAVQPAGTPVPGEGDSEIFMDNNRHQYFWTSTPFGVRYKKYVLPLSQRQVGQTI